MLREVSQMRMHQRLVGYDDEHDDEHTPAEWVAEFAYQLGKLGGNFRDKADGPGWRRMLLVLAALFVAAIESYDRRNGLDGPPVQPLPPPSVPPPASPVREPRRPRPKGPGVEDAMQVLSDREESHARR